MKKYRVKIEYRSIVTSEVEAENERDAENTARDETDANLISINATTENVTVRELAT